MAETKGSTSIDPRLVRKLADILTDTGLTEIEVEQEGLRIRVARELTAAAAPVTYAAAPVAVAASAPAAAPQAAPAAAETPAAPVGEAVKSPMVGTVYLQAKPGDDPFIRVGDRVSAGQTLLIVEAMKTMNPIASPRAGVVLQILVDDATPVEFGEPLVILE
ncbi:MAG: acetyl-CoA carboxylase biotin carboxyl carrier protein [Caulobacteraceae bacterium]|nr:acetyl-CoA carboxylase biotin carboxyl carrier protein [Caulobacteraceae bacterium]